MVDERAGPLSIHLPFTPPKLLSSSRLPPAPTPAGRSTAWRTARPTCPLAARVTAVWDREGRRRGAFARGELPARVDAALMAGRAPSTERWRVSPPGRGGVRRRPGRLQPRLRFRSSRSPRRYRAGPRCIRGTARAGGEVRERASWSGGHSSNIARPRQREPSNPHRSPAPCVWRSVSCWPPSCVRTTCARLRALRTGRSGTSRGRPVARTAHIGLQHGEQRIADDRSRAAPRGTARRWNGHRRAGGGRRPCRALRPSIPVVAACPWHGRRVGSVPDRDRRRSCPPPRPWRGGPYRRRAASRRNAGTA